jgi:hypothetical protein
MIMSTFAESYDFADKTVHPVTTYAMSALGTTPEDYARECRGARIGTGLAVRGEKARSAGADVDSLAAPSKSARWLRRSRVSHPRLGELRTGPRSARRYLIAS